MTSYKDVVSSCLWCNLFFLRLDGEQCQRLWQRVLEAVGKDSSAGRLGPLTQARSPAGSTKPLTLKEVIGRKQRVQGLQAGQGELSTQAQLCRGQGCRSDLEEHLPKG